MDLVRALAGGFAGACTLTLLHQAARQVTADAPRMDVLGERALARGFRAAGQEPPAGDDLHRLALGGDLLFNTLFYSLAGCGGREGVWARGALLGLAAGLGGVLLPGPLGLGTKPSARTPQTALMAVGWYLAGGLATAAALDCMSA